MKLCNDCKHGEYVHLIWVCNGLIINPVTGEDKSPGSSLCANVNLDGNCALWEERFATTDGG